MVADAPLEPFIDFVTGARMVAYLELRAVEPTRLEGTSVRVDVTDSSGVVRVTANAPVVSTNGTWAVARAELPLASLPAGRFVTEARVMAGMKELARVSRPFTHASHDRQRHGGNVST